MLEFDPTITGTLLGMPAKNFRPYQPVSVYKTIFINNELHKQLMAEFWTGEITRHYSIAKLHIRYARKFKKYQSQYMNAISSFYRARQTARYLRRISKYYTGSLV
jgi:hypothetical protein